MLHHVIELHLLRVRAPIHEVQTLAQLLGAQITVVTPHAASLSAARILVGRVLAASAMPVPSPAPLRLRRPYAVSEVP